MTKQNCVWSNRMAKQPACTQIKTERVKFMSWKHALTSAYCHRRHKTLLQIYSFFQKSSRHTATDWKCKSLTVGGAYVKAGTYKHFFIRHHMEVTLYFKPLYIKHDQSSFNALIIPCNAPYNALYAEYLWPQLEYIILIFLIS